MKTKVFEINYPRLCQLLLPTFLRKKGILSFLRALCYPVEQLRDDHFRPTRLYNLVRIDTTPSVCKLEYMLNYHFFKEAARKDISREEERIYIEGVEGIPLTYIYLAGIKGVSDYNEGIVLPIYNKTENTEPAYLYTGSEAGKAIDDFVVKVPVNDSIGILTNTKKMEMEGFVRSYMLQDKKFSIVNV